MVKAQLEISKNKSREADIRITKLIDEGIIKSVSYGPELKPIKGKEIEVADFGKNLVLLCKGKGKEVECRIFDKNKQKDTTHMLIRANGINGITHEVLS